MESYSIDSVIRGYHIYKDIWTAPIGAILHCGRESSNPSDPYTVAMSNGTVVVGHVPQVISAAYSASITLAFLTSGFTKLFTALIREDGIVFGNDPVGCGRSGSGVISFCLKYFDIIHFTLKIRHKSINI